MNDSKVSTRALESSLTKASGLAKDGATVYRSVRNLMITFGLSASIFLPLASSDSPPPPPPPPVVQLFQPAPVVVNNTVERREPDNIKPNIKVVVNTSPIQGAAPISRDWHRTTFSQRGDEFWALPDAGFILDFTPGAGFSTCRGDACQGSWLMTNEDRSLLATIETLGKRGLKLNPSNTLLECKKRVLENAVSETLSCRLKRLPEEPDRCIWIRRTEYKQLEINDESTNEDPYWPLQGILALDIRWQLLDAADDDCLQLMSL